MPAWARTRIRHPDRDRRSGRQSPRSRRPADDRGWALHPRGWRDRRPKLAADSTLVGIVGSTCSDETVGGIKSHHRGRPDHDLALQHASRAHGAEPRRDVRGLHPHRAQRLVPGQGRSRVRVQRAQADEGCHDPRWEQLRPGAPAGVCRRVHEARWHHHHPGGRVQGQTRHEAGPDPRSPPPTRSSSTTRTSSPRAATSTDQIKEVPGLENVKTMGADGTFSADFVKAAGAAAEGHYLSSPDFTAFGSGYQALVDKIKAKFGQRAAEHLPCSRVRRREHADDGDREGRGDGRGRHAVHPEGSAPRRPVRDQGLPGDHGTAHLHTHGRLRRSRHRPSTRSPPASSIPPTGRRQAPIWPAAAAVGLALSSPTQHDPVEGRASVL